MARNFLKHIGKHGDRKVAIIYRVVPNEDHMCLVVYPDILPTAFHDAIMTAIDSVPGQQASNLSDVLHRNLLTDGRPILETLHREGMIKKVPTNQIVVTPNANSHVRLDELNKILDDIEKGEEAAENMRKLDEGAGFVDPSRPEPARKINENQSKDNLEAAPIQSAPGDMTDMSDEGIAKQRLFQSQRMANEAQVLLAESKRLQEEAWELNPSLKPAEAKKDTTEVSKDTPKAAPKKKAIRKKAVKKKAVKDSAKTDAKEAKVTLESNTKEASA